MQRSHFTLPERASDSILAHIGNTPLVRLRAIDRDLPVPILAKCEHVNPGGSVKDRIALSIVNDAEARGVLKPGGTIVEATAGNTGLGLAMVAAVRSYRVVCVMPEKMSEDKRRALRAAGVDVRIVPNAPPDHPDNFQRVAERLSQEHGWFLADQFRNAANVRAHETGTGPEILAQTDGAIGAFVAGVGTGGTITGVGRHLKSRVAGVRIVLADPVGSTLAGWVREGRPGADGAYAVEGIGSSRAPEILDFSVVDDAESVSDEESFAMARRLARDEGLFVGGSAGTAVVAAVRVATRADVSHPVVVLLPDGWDRYRSCAWIFTAG